MKYGLSSVMPWSRVRAWSVSPWARARSALAMEILREKINGIQGLSVCNPPPPCPNSKLVCKSIIVGYFTLNVRELRKMLGTHRNQALAIGLHSYSLSLERLISGDIQFVCAFWNMLGVIDEPLNL